MPELFARITKVDETKRTVTGRAAQEVVDRDNEIFDYESSKPNFMKWSAEVHADSEGKSLGNVRAMHGQVAAGKLQDIQFLDAEKAIDIEAKIVDDNEWRKCLEGVYTGFSIGGRYTRKWVDTQAGKVVNRYTANPTEISIVDRPCMPTAKFYEVHKADGTVLRKLFKSAEAADGGADLSKDWSGFDAARSGGAASASHSALQHATGAGDKAALHASVAADKITTQVYATGKGHGKAAAAHHKAAAAHYKAAGKTVGFKHAAHQKAVRSHEHAAAAHARHATKAESGELEKFDMPTNATSGVQGYDLEGAKPKKRKAVESADAEDADGTGSGTDEEVKDRLPAVDASGDGTGAEKRGRRHRGPKAGAERGTDWDGFDDAGAESQGDPGSDDDDDSYVDGTGDGEMKCDDGGMKGPAKRDFSSKERDVAADAGQALPDGSFPIKSVQDLKNAVRAYGRASDKVKAKAHIVSRAKALGATDQLPDDWRKADGGDLEKGDASGHEFRGNQYKDAIAAADKHAEHAFRGASSRDTPSSALSGDAVEATGKALRDNTASSHDKAAVAHRAAARMQGEDGYQTTASAHDKAANAHERAASILRSSKKTDGGDLEKGDVSGHEFHGNQYQQAAAAASKAAESARNSNEATADSKQDLMSWQAGEKTAAAMKSGSASAHERAMSAHISAANKARSDGQTRLARLHTNAANAHGMAAHLARSKKSDDGDLEKADAGDFEKGVEGVVSLAQLACQLKYLADGQGYERAAEGDASDMPDKLRAKAAELLRLVGEMAAEEGDELAEGETADNPAAPAIAMEPGLYRDDVGDLAKSLREQLGLAKEGRRNSAKDLVLIQKVHDAACELGAGCAGPPRAGDGQDQASNQETTMTDVKKGDGGTICSEAKARGATVTDASGSKPAPTSSNADDHEPVGDAGQEKRKARMARKDEDEDEDMDSSKKRKARKDEDEDEDEDFPPSAKKRKARKDEDYDDDDDMDDDAPPSKGKGAKKALDPEDLAKVVATAVATAMAGVLGELAKAQGAAKEDAVTIPRVPPNLFAVDKGGAVTKVAAAAQLDELRKSVAPVPGDRDDAEDRGGATVIKAIRARGPTAVLSPEQLALLEAGMPLPGGG